MHILMSKSSCVPLCNLKHIVAIQARTVYSRQQRLPCEENSAALQPIGRLPTLLFTKAADAAVDNVEQFLHPCLA